MKEEIGREKRAPGRHLQKQEGHRQERSALVWFKDGGGGCRIGEVAEGEEGGVVRVRERLFGPFVLLFGPFKRGTWLSLVAIPYSVFLNERQKRRNCFSIPGHVAHVSPRRLQDGPGQGRSAPQSTAELFRPSTRTSATGEAAGCLGRKNSFQRPLGGGQDSLFQCRVSREKGRIDLGSSRVGGGSQAGLWC